jgi:hypothetical protein
MPLVFYVSFSPAKRTPRLYYCPVGSKSDQPTPLCMCVPVDAVGRTSPASETETVSSSGKSTDCHGRSTDSPLLSVVNERTAPSLGHLKDGRTDGRSRPSQCGSTNERTDGRMDGRFRPSQCGTNERTNERTDGRTDGSVPLGGEQRTGCVGDELSVTRLTA